MLWLYLNFDSLQLEALETSKDTAVIIVDPFSNQVTQANQVALTAGIKLNMGLAMAISITSDIEVVEYKEKIEQESLTNIANMLYRYTADISLDAPQGMFLRIDNMLRLYESLSTYWSTITAQLNNLGFSYSYGAAPIALSAKLIALSKHNTLYDQSVLAQQYINSLPTDYLELTKAQKEQFHRVGFKRIGDVLAIPLKSLSKRFDLSVFTYLGQLSGQIKFPMSLFSPTLHYKRTLELLFEISNANILINPINKLLKELELFFRNRNLLSSQLKFTFLYRHNSGLTINVIAAGGEYKASVWLRLIKLQLESVKLLEPAVTISLECVGLEPQQSRTKDIFSDKMSQLESTQLHNKLIAKLSTGKVTRPTFIDSINPELVTKLNTDLCTKNSNLLVNHETAMQRPSFIQAKASKLVEPVKALHGPERILTGWWDGKSIYRDYFIAQNSQGQWLWIYRTPKQEWFVQGWFRMSQQQACQEGGYAELSCFSNFTFLKGASSPEELIEQSCQLGYSALAITDECSVAGVVRAYSHVKKEGLNIKLIVGSQFEYQNNIQLTLLCPNRKAYAELCRIITNARRRCDKGEYELNLWDLKSIRECIILWHASGDLNKDETNLTWLKGLNKFIPKKLYIGMTRKLTNREHCYIHNCEEIAKRHQLPIVACGQVLMHCITRLPLQHVLTAIKQGTQVNNIGRKALTNAEQSLRPISKLQTLYKKQYLDISLEIADLCTFDLGELRYEYPSELIPSQSSPSEYLKELVNEGKKYRFPQGVPVDIEVLIEKELKLIHEMEYEHFFITIYDIVQYAKTQNILYQGRGSAANSVVCFCLEITAVDPSQINVLFERFISKERNEPPDIDVDFEHQRREEIYQYIYEKYGRKHAALAATVVTYRTKSAIREVGKALGYEELQLDFFIKNINRRDAAEPWFSQISTLSLSIDSSKAQQLISLVEQIKGFPRHLSQHVGGFIISSGPLHELVPVENAAMDNRTVIQWDKDDLETLALLKVDVLALGMLSAIRKSFEYIESFYNTKLSIADITAGGDDQDVYQMISAADTVGVFQIESRAQMSMLPRLKPATYYDLVIQIAIVRPGPIQGGMVHPYLRRRDGLEPITYPSEDVESVLSRTLGVPIFQEQVIKLAMVAAGFSGGEADQLRRAMGKWKKNGEIEKFRIKLINGMSKRGYTQEYAERIFQQICGFGEYGFPESHSASFAVLAYVSSWLKHYYPAAFYCGLLNSLPMGFYGPSQLLQDASRHGVDILPICINASCWDHQLVITEGEVKLRLGFRLIKGFSESSVDLIMTSKAKHENGFTHLNQITSSGLNKRDLQLLASANAFAMISGDRYTTRWSLMNMEAELPLFKNIDEGSTPHQELDLDSYTKHIVKTPTKVESMLEDYAATNISIHSHPIQLLREKGLLGKYTAAEDLISCRHKSVVTVVGLVTGRQSPGTAGGVTFVTLEDDTGSSNVVIWVATARAQKKSFLTSKLLKVKGVVEREGRVIHVIAGKLIDLSDELQELEIKSRDFH